MYFLAQDGTFGLDAQFDSLSSGIQSMYSRVAVLVDFVKKTERGDVPPNHLILRQIDGLLRQWPVMIGYAFPKNLASEFSDALIIGYLAAIAKAVKTVQLYSERFQLSRESGVCTSRELRRGY